MKVFRKQKKKKIEQTENKNFIEVSTIPNLENSLIEEVQKENDLIENQTVNDTTEIKKIDTLSDLSEGPFDANSPDVTSEMLNSRMDMGSILIPIIDGANIGFDVNEKGEPQGFNIHTNNWTMTLVVYATPKSSPQWLKYTEEIVNSLNKKNAKISFIDGKWGKEILADFNGKKVFFTGVNGPKWMLKCVLTGGENLDSTIDLARNVVRHSIVRRDRKARTLLEKLPIVLPTEVLENLLGQNLSKDEDDYDD